MRKNKGKTITELPRAEMNSLLDKAGGVVIGTLILLIALALAVLPRPEQSAVEKRKLEEFPEFSAGAVLSGEYARGIDKWYTDTVPFRDNLTGAAVNLTGWYGFRPDGVKIYDKGNRPTLPGGSDTMPPDLPPDDTTLPPETSASPETTSAPETSAAPDTTDVPVTTDVPDTTTEPVVTTAPDTTAAPETTTAPDTTSAPDTTGEELPDVNELLRDNGIIVYKKRAIMLYYGTYETSQSYVNIMNRFAKALGSDVKCWSMVTPTSVAYYLPSKYSSYTHDQAAHIQYIAEKLEGVKEANAYEALLPHVNENIYTRTDHHWTTLGAYYAAQAFAKTAGVPFADLSTYTKVSREGYVGTMYAFTGDPVLKNNPETFTYYMPNNQYSAEFYTSKKDANGRYTVAEYSHTGSLFFEWVDLPSSYCVFIGSDQYLIHVKTDCHNGRKLFVIKDSYGNALIPFLTSSFEEIYVVDFRYFEKDCVAFMKEHGVTDFLVSMCSFFSCGSGPAYLEDMISK